MSKIEGQEYLLQDAIQRLESTQQDVNVMEAMTQANKTINELQAMVPPEKFESLLSNLEDQEAIA